MVANRVFVLSTGRTGTTFVAEALSRLGADARHEPGPVWLRNLSNARVSGAVGHETASRLVRRVRPDDSPSIPYVEASCLIYGLAEELLEVFDDALVVHLVRDPRTYIRSAMDWGVHRLAGRPLNLAPYRRLATAQSAPFDPRERWRWAVTPRFDRIAWGWTAMNEAIRRTCESTSRAMTVRFEELVDETHSGLFEIARAAGIVDDPSRVEALELTRVNAAPKRGFADWTEWTRDQMETVLRLCGDEAAHYGYDIEAGFAPFLSV